MGKSQMDGLPTHSADETSLELTKARQALHAILAVPPLTFLNDPEPKVSTALPARQVGDGPALSPENQEIAAFVRADWRTATQLIQSGVVRVCELTGSPQLAFAMSQFVGIVQKVANAVARHDEEVRIRVGAYSRTSPPQTGGPFIWKGTPQAERAWREKMQGPDVYGATFCYFQGNPRKELRDAWQWLTATADSTPTGQLVSHIDQPAAKRPTASSWRDVTVLLKGASITISVGKDGSRLCDVRTPPRAYMALAAIASNSNGEPGILAVLNGQSKRGRTVQPSKLAQSVKAWLRRHVNCPGEPMIAVGERGQYQVMFRVRLHD